MTLFKRLVARLPDRWQSELKRIHYGRQILKGTFEPAEPEFELLPRLIRSGDWVIDVGANVGQYTQRFSELVGAEGRVIAFEPLPSTCALLAANVQLFAHPNVTIINAAVSDRTDVVSMSVPRFSTGLPNYYQAHLSSSAEDCAVAVLCLSVDSLCIDRRIRLIKIDAEGHEASVLKGMQRLVAQHRPVLIIETSSENIIANLVADGYEPARLANSPNVVFSPS